MDRSFGLDAHLSSCTVVAVGPSGKQLQTAALDRSLGIATAGGFAARHVVSYRPNPAQDGIKFLAAQEGIERRLAVSD